MNLAIFVSFVIFLIGALAGLFEWSLGDFDPLMWGLVFFSFGHLGAVGDYVNRTFRR